MHNLFSSIDEYELPSSFGSIDDILDEAGDDEFLDALAEDDELAEDVIALLDDVLDDDPADADQEVALLLADVYLAASGADDTVNNVNGLLGDPDSFDFDSPEDIITDLFILDGSLSQLQQEEAVSRQLEAFLGAAEALELYGETIDSQGPSSEVVGGELVAAAMIGGMTTYLADDLLNTIGNGIDTKEKAIEAISSYIVAGTVLPNMTGTPSGIEDILSDGLLEVLGPDTVDNLSDMG